MVGFSYFFALLLFLNVFSVFSAGRDRIGRFESVGEETSLVSGESTFKLGFFSPGSSKNRYLGIWYNKISVQTVVWVANRCDPIADSSGVLTIKGDGSLALSEINSSIVWSTSSSKQAKKPILQLLDSGNLVLREESDDNPETYLWQSFDHPSDTWLPGMKIGFNTKTGHRWTMSAWKNGDDPCPTELICSADPHPLPELSIKRNGTKYFRHGPWNGLDFCGTVNLRPNPVKQFMYFEDTEAGEVSFRYHFNISFSFTRIVLNPGMSSCQQLQWVEAQRLWSMLSASPTDYCDNYGLCGENGNCILSTSPVCRCLTGFKPKSPENWDSLVWTEGCVRNSPLDCTSKERHGFVKFEHTKAPDTTNTWVNRSMTLSECRAKCLKNCSCSAYANVDIAGSGSGCVIWIGDLIDVRQVSGGGQDLYVRVPASETAAVGSTVKAAIITGVVLGAFGILLVSCYMYRRAFQERNRGKSTELEDREEDLELKLFDLATINAATRRFSLQNKLGEGGFGAVYRGKLEDGQEIAVKRLSANSGQGVKEFKNEVALIAKLQHRNLVKLNGYCIDGEEKLLVYEYLTNKSLDTFIFDQKEGKTLEWSTRFNIICGIARGILYLHHDSRLRIVHRDLKASNVLLDGAMNPKISDFGLARTFGGDQIEGETNRVVGTYGYMAPEYAFKGVFSTKSDIFSFGIMVLEIVSGKRCRVFRPENDSLTLTGHAWKLMREGKAIELLDPNLTGLHNPCEVLRCILVGLLCVQQRPVDRPDISSVVLMLGNDRDSELPYPEKPGYFMEADLPPENFRSWPTNNMTISVLEAR